MKRKHFKKGGFSLAEIVVAFAIFAIFATLIAQVINLTVNQRNQNTRYVKKLAEEQNKLYTTEKTTTYDKDKASGDKLTLKFEGLSDLNIEYMMVDAAGNAGSGSGLNYFVGNIDYGNAEEGSVIQTNPGAGNNNDDHNIGASQASRFDTRLTGTKGLTHIKINKCKAVAGDSSSYEMTTSCVFAEKSATNPGGVQSDNLNYVTYTIYFPKNVVSITPAESCPYNVLKSGSNGVKICAKNKTTTVSSGILTTFTVKLADNPGTLDKNSFGKNANDGAYTAYIDDKGYVYTNIYGAYPKKS